MDKQEQLMKGLGESVRRIMEKLEGDFGWLQEIRMRIGAPLFVIYRGEEYAVTKPVSYTHLDVYKRQRPYVCERACLDYE